MTIQRYHVGPRLSEIVVHSNTVYLCGQIADNLDKDAKASPLISVGYSKLNLFGEDMVTSCGVAARALNALAMADIEVLLITTSDLDISLLVHAENEDAAYEALKKAYEL